MLPASNADEIDKVTSPPRSAPTGRENHGTVHRPDGRSRRRARRRFPSARSHGLRSEEHTSELQSLMRISYAVFCLKQKTPPPSQSSPKIILTRYTTLVDT